jgi:hypothetical protein
MCKLLCKSFIIIVVIILVVCIFEYIYNIFKEEATYLEFQKIWNIFQLNFNQLAKNSTETIINSNLIKNKTIILQNLIQKINTKN